MRACWRLGVVHGDLSAYNLLWWEGRVVLIDFPQSMDREQPGARELLAQDAASLALSFRGWASRSIPTSCCGG
jgi:RIO kinase 1